MADKSAIEWTEATWNPVVGCTKVSEGCDHCYAERLVNGRLRNRYPGGFGEVTLLPERLDQPLRWRKPRRVFVNSLSDLFHDQIPDEFIAWVFATMAATPRHTYQILTKRPGRMASLLNASAFIDRVQAAHDDMSDDHEVFHGQPLDQQAEPWPLRNVWLGVSVENQKWADVRIPKLLQCPAAIRFLSCEPLLGPIDLGRSHPGFPYIGSMGGTTFQRNHIDWVIVGGESGPNARPMHPLWAHDLRKQCQAASVPFFFKQWGEWLPVREVYDQEVSESGDDPLDAYGLMETTSLNVRGSQEQGWARDDGKSWGHQPNPSHYPWWLIRAGKKHAGRQLDGREWNEYPDQPVESGDAT